MSDPRQTNINEPQGSMGSMGSMGRNPNPTAQQLQQQPGLQGQEKPRAFDAQGSIGKQFTEQGALGGAAQKLGGVFDKEGAVGKQFTPEGSLGGTVQENLGGTKKTT